jgi:uncharacterized protein (DUF2236 family)
VVQRGPSHPPGAQGLRDVRGRYDGHPPAVPAPAHNAAIADHSAYQSDPWGRMRRTSHFIAATTFGRPADARAAIAQVRAIHEHIAGTASDGRPYAASDPHLLTWVHVAEVDAFLRAYTAYGGKRLDQAERDGYVADQAPAVPSVAAAHRSRPSPSCWAARGERDPVGSVGPRARGRLSLR